MNDTKENKYCVVVTHILRRSLPIYVEAPTEDDAIEKIETFIDEDSPEAQEFWAELMDAFEVFPQDVMEYEVYPAEFGDCKHKVV